MTGGDFIMNGRDLHDKILSNSGQILECEIWPNSGLRREHVTIQL